jgi:hypothetical protein
MDRAVARGLASREQGVIPFLGIDVTSFHERHEYLTVVGDLGKSRGSVFGSGVSIGALEVLGASAER